MLLKFIEVHLFNIMVPFFKNRRDFYGIEKFKIFLTVVEASSISKAAKILNITQPTLSRQLKELEIELGAELFKREPKGIKLTEDGIFLKNRSEEILSLASKTQQEFDNKRNKNWLGISRLDVLKLTILTP